jgi:cyclophilin family peptidyl-prolyl cis-trans isomerase
MSRVKLTVAALAAAAVSYSVPHAQAPSATAKPTPTVLVVDTVKGAFEIETFPTDAPKSVARIVELVRANFYRGLRVHSASQGLIEFGDPTTRNMSKMGDWGLAGSGKRIGVREVSKRAFDRGIVGYAYPRDRQPEDADSHLFVLKMASPSSNGKFAPIGRVTRGMEIVDKLAAADVIRNVTIKAAPAPGAK